MTLIGFVDAQTTQYSLAK